LFLVQQRNFDKTSVSGEFSRMKVMWSALFALALGATPEALNPLNAQLKDSTCQIYEESGVTHAKAQNEIGAFACLGYLHGRDRAWQMDFFRRIVQGRRAEILGYKSLKDDLQMRLLGLDRKAAQLFDQMNDEQKAPLWAYTYGVNQGFRSERATSSYEFRHYGYQPEEWTPIHTIEVLLLQSFDQTRETFTRKIDESAWTKQYGNDASVLFARQGFPWSTTILKPGEYPLATSSRPHDEAADQVYPIPSSLRSLYPEVADQGSNNWAVAPQRSVTGNAFFSNDPHLELKHPPFWYWVHLEGGPIDAIGASLPGAPAIASGANHHVAWGLTNSYFDVSELAYVPNKDLEGGNTESFHPMVWVKVGPVKLPFFFKGFRRTAQNWPILPLEGGPADHALVLRWSGYEIAPADLFGMKELLTVQSAQEADTALTHLGLPSWNFTFADTHGVIGYRTTGKLPKREKPLPFGIPTRHLSELAPWTFLNADEAPHVLQPKRGYVVTANNEQWPEDSRYQDGRAQAPSFRAFRIEELLKETTKHDLKTLQKIQCDEQAIDARFILPPLLKVLESDSSSAALPPRAQKVVEALKQWDFKADESCRSCAVWNRWLDLILSVTDLNREALYRQVRTEKPDPEFLTAVRTTFQTALDEVKVGPQGELPTWGEVHRNAFQHFSGDPAFEVPSIATGGVTQSVSPGTSRWDAARGMYLQTAGASQRLIVELANPPIVHSMLTGSNLDIEKPNLSDPQGPWMKWKRCELERKSFPLDWSRVEGQSVVFR
jgi:penicillin amidase